MDNDCFLTDKILKKLTIILVIFMISCQNNGVKKPDNLIEKNQMVEILYDVSLLEAIKSQGINGGVSNAEINRFIKEKYGVDSTQFVQNNRYYAADVVAYKKMFEKIKSRVEQEIQKNTTNGSEPNYGQETIQTTSNSTKNSDTPTVY